MRGGGAQGSNGFLGPWSIPTRKVQAHIFLPSRGMGEHRIVDEASFFFRTKEKNDLRGRGSRLPDILHYAGREGGG